MPGKIIVSGVGCCLVDLLYNDIDFSSDTIRLYLSKKRGDGGLTPGHLVFQEEFEKYSGSSLDKFLKKITGGRTHDKINIGGPSIVSLINLAQLIDKEHCEVRFYGRGGKDEIGQYLLSSLSPIGHFFEGFAFSFLKSNTVLTIVTHPFDLAFFRREVILSCINGTRAVPPKTTMSELKKSSSSSSGL